MTIELKDVSYFYDKRIILENVNLTIKQNDFLGIIGPNGGGKTTLLKIMLGLLEPKGRVLVFGQSPKKVLEKLAYVPQEFNVEKDFPISVFEVIILGAISKIKFKYPKKLKEKTNYFLKKIGLFEKRSHYFSSLSGGEKKKVLIARALISDPEILILDEPTSNIDLHAEKTIFDLLLQYRGKKTILMVNHDLNIIIKYIEKVIFVQKTVTVNLPKDVCEHFALGLYHKPLL